MLAEFTTDAINRADALGLAIKALEVKAAAYQYAERFTTMLKESTPASIQADIRRLRQYQAAIRLLQLMRDEADKEQIPF